LDYYLLVVQLENLADTIFSDKDTK
jgi:hypothetical protein